MAFKGEIPIKNKYKSPAKNIDPTGNAALFQFGAGLVEGFGAMSKRSDLRGAQTKAQGSYDDERQAFLDLDLSNPYANMTNYYANMENTMEDLTINQEEAEFMKNQQMQTSANIMQSLKGAAGGSGVAGLAQAMSNQSAINSAKSAASIGQQERANQVARASQQASLDKMQAKGATDVQTYERAGELWKRNAEMDRQEFLMQEAGMNLTQANLAMTQNKADIQKGFATATGGFLDRASEVQKLQLGGTGFTFGGWLQQFMGI